MQYAIDELKAHVPIWKKEVYDGEAAAAWKENPDWARGGAGKSRRRPCGRLPKKRANNRRPSGSVPEWKSRPLVLLPRHDVR